MSSSGAQSKASHASRAGQRRAKKRTAQHIKSGIASTQTEQATHTKTANKYPRTEKQRIACSAAQKSTVKQEHQQKDAEAKQGKIIQITSEASQSTAKEKRGDARQRKSNPRKDVQTKQYHATQGKARRTTEGSAMSYKARHT